MSLSFLDMLALAILLVSAVWALAKGLAAEIVALASVVLGVFLAAFYYPRSASVLEKLGVAETLSGFLGFISLFLLAVVGGAVLVRLIDKTLRTLRLKWIDRLLGGLFGLARGFLINVALFLALAAFPVGEDLLTRSATAEIFLAAAGLLTRLVPGKLREDFNNGYERVTRKWQEGLQPETVVKPETDH